MVSIAPSLQVIGDQINLRVGLIGSYLALKMEFFIEPITDEVEIAKYLGEPNQAIKAEVDAAIAKALSRFEEHFDRKFTPPVVLYDLVGHTAGWAIGMHTIRLNIECLYNEYHDDMIERIVPHEIAHIVQTVLYPDSKPHGGEWQYLMHILGLPADRTHSFKTKAARKHPRPYIYRCYCKERPITQRLHNRIQNGSGHYCTSCRGTLTFVRKED